MSDGLKIIFPVAMNSVRLADDIFEVVSKNVTSDKRLSYCIRTVLSEAFSNAFLYGDKSNGEAVIEVKTCFSQNTFCVSIINDGKGFSDNGIEWDQFPSGQQESGRGLKIIRKLSDRVEFKKLGDDRFEVYVEFETRIGKKQIK